MSFFLLSARIALADLMHERIMSVCVTLALVSIMTPLMILYGLKNGEIASTRENLLRNPANLEIRPVVVPSGHKLTSAWFASMRANPHTGFIIPQVQYATTSSVILSKVSAHRGDKVPVDLWPTDVGDPLLSGQGGPGTSVVNPIGNQCVLSDLAAKNLRVSPGEQILVKATRTNRNPPEAVLQLAVVGILPPGLPGIEVIFAPLTLVEAFEDFKSGKPVSTFGWAGDVQAEITQPGFESVLVLERITPSTGDLDKMLEAGFASSERLKHAQWPMGWQLPPDRHLRAFHTIGNPASADNLKRLQQCFGKENPPDLIPWNPPFPVRLTVPDHVALEGVLQTFPATLAAASALNLAGPARLLGVTDAVPWLQPDYGMEAGPPRFLVAPEVYRQMGGRVQCRLISDPEFTFPVQLIEMDGLGPGQFLSSSALSGVLKRSTLEPVVFDEKEGRFLRARSDHARFRLYASSLEGVAPLKRLLEAEGIQVTTEPGRIEQAFALDRRLNLIFQLIGLVTVAGGMLSLLAGLVASVERKRYDLAVLKMIGFPRVYIAALPVWQSLMLTATAFALSLVIFLLFNRLASHFLKAGQGFCRVSGEEFRMAAVGALLLGAAVSLLAALRVTRIEPAEALRRE